jgi:Tetratricopeptide repeat
MRSPIAIRHSSFAAVLVLAACAAPAPAPVEQPPSTVPAPASGIPSPLPTVPTPEATVPPPAAPQPPIEARPLPIPEARPGPKENVAVAGLMDSARNDASSGKYPSAAASLERALRIEPRNPRLWQELARVRLKQGDYAQAENLAARSTGWAGNDTQLRADNWRIIAAAREARGDRTGAQAALQQADKLAH